MNDHNKSTAIKTVPCEICLKEVPRSEAKVVEVDDYVLYFCGLDCFGKWQEKEVGNKGHKKAPTENRGS